MPTYEWLARFRTDFDSSTAMQQAASLRAVRQLLEDLRGWSSPEVVASWRDRADVLVRRLREELPPDVRLDVDLWPLEG